MYIHTYFGRSLVFDNGLKVGFNWVHGNGRSSKSSAVLAAYHPPRSITWIWALYWKKPTGWLPRVRKGWKMIGLELPMLGGLEFCWQEAMPHNA